MKFRTLVAVSLLMAWPALAWSQESKRESKKEVERRTTEKAESKKDQVDVKDGKIVIVGKDGEKHEIPVEHAREFGIQKTVVATEQDGDVKQKVTGKAIIVGPDGERQEIDLTGTDFNFEVGGDPAQFRLFRIGEGEAMEGLPAMLETSSKYFVGVHCEPVDAALRSHLKIDENQGLMVHGVTDDSPAAKAGLKENDILLYANDKQLSSLEQLVEIVEQAGKDDVAITFSIIRAGEETKVDVKPAERKGLPARLELKEGMELEGLHEHLLKMDPNINLGELREKMKLPKFGPGIIRAGALDGEHLEKMRVELDAARAEMEKAQTRMREEMVRVQDEIRKQMEDAQKQMQEALKAQQKALKEMKSKNEKDKN